MPALQEEHRQGIARSEHAEVWMRMSVTSRHAVHCRYAEAAQGHGQQPGALLQGADSSAAKAVPCQVVTHGQCFM